MEIYPPVSFHFRVTFQRINQPNPVHDNYPDLGKDEIDTRFQSVSGLSVDLQTDTYKEGGENRFEHILPTRTKYGNLILKRGLFSDSTLIQWCLDTFENLSVEPKNIVISLLNDEHQPLVTWKVMHAWPLKWSVSDLNAESSQLAIETLELAYRYFTME